MSTRLNDSPTLRPEVTVRIDGEWHVFRRQEEFAQFLSAARLTAVRRGASECVHSIERLEHGEAYTGVRRPTAPDRPNAALEAVAKKLHSIALLAEVVIIMILVWCVHQHFG